jgi:hypothetical protein
VLAPIGIALIVLAVCSAVALAVSGGLRFRSAAPAHARAAAVTGSLTQSNSRDGGAILGATGMRPGDVVGGDVTIANTGDLAGAFQLSQTPLTETPGAGGGRLSSKLQLQVFDVTDPAAPQTMWAGDLGAFAGRDLGTFGAGQARTYRFVVTFPDSGSAADNAFAGSSSTVRFVWTAIADDPAAAAPTPSPTPAATTPGAVTPRTTTVWTSGALINLTVPGGCVKRGGVFKATLRWKKIKRKGNVFVKINRTDFYVNKKRVRIDRRAPFAASFRIPFSAKAGSTIALRARAYIKVKKGRAPKKSIRASVRICS